MKKLYLSFVQKVFIFSLLITPLFGTAQQIDLQNLPSFTYNDEVPVDKGKFLPAAQTWQPRQTMISTVIFSADLQLGSTSWKTYGPDWQITNGKAGTADYHNGKSSYLISPAFTLGKGASKLRYKEKFELESYHDFGLVWITADNGAHWRQLHAVTGITDWRETYIDLRAYQGKTIQFAFMLKTDESISGSGWQIEGLDVVNVQDKVRSVNTATKAKSSALVLAQQLQDSLNVILTGRETNTFPTISATVRVEGMSSLTKENFKACENGIEQTDQFNVFPPDSIQRPADIVFLVDNSSSMSDEQQAVQNSINAFVNDLFDSGIDAALGLTRFGQSSFGGAPIVEENGTLFTNPDVFLNTVFTKNIASGGYEPGLAAMLQSVSAFNFRPNSQKIFILLTDEDSDGFTPQASDVLPVLDQNAITLFSIIRSISGSSQVDYGDLAIDSGGLQFEIFNLSDPTILQPIIDAISTTIAENTYLLTYRSSKPTLDGVERKVDIKVTAGDAIDTVSFRYTPGAAPSISLQQSTLDLIANPQPENNALTIQTSITDLNEPFVQSAILFYRNTGAPTYESVGMSNVSGDLWEAIIPASVAIMPGVDFYITATDGISTTSDRANSPAENPYQITINPNVAPKIVHNSIITLNNGDDLVISSEITDTTNEVASASLFYRNVGEPLYRKVPLANTNGNIFTAMVSASMLSINGVQYYLKATDNFGISTYFGEPDDPILIEIIQGSNPATFTLIDSQTDVDILEIQDGGEYAVEDLPESIAIRFDPATGDVGSIVFDLKGPFFHRMTETNAPYAIFGNVGNDYTGRIFPPGEYTLTATPYSQGQGQGTAGAASQVNFKITLGDVPNDLAIIGFDLYDAFSDTQIMELTDGTVIDLGTLDHNDLTVLINTLPDFIGSVMVELEGPVSNIRIENNKPYTLFENNSINYYGREFVTGSYTLRATPYTQMNAGGTSGTPLEINFTVEGIPEMLKARESDLVVYPLPFKDNFFIDQKEVKGDLSAKLFNLQGQPIMVATSPKQDGINVMAPNSLREGLYILKVFDKDQLVKTIKIQKGY